MGNQFLQHGGATSHGQPPCKAGRTRPGHDQVSLQEGDRLQPRPAPACSTALARGSRLQDARNGLLPTTSPTARRGGSAGTGVAAPWQGDCRWERATAACTGSTTVAATQRGQ
ncbi:hypothetical protein BHE74_00020650 [Ensete ventricosum]|nr:hypothetical protein BHE74_00020650 [Ensete ventricosum]